jgi:membrane peptidoglycan carboxypeptidase
MDLSLYQLVAAQCIFPNNGIYVRPTTIERITDRNGKVIYSATEHREQALNSTVVELLRQLQEKQVRHKITRMDGSLESHQN